MSDHQAAEGASPGEASSSREPPSNGARLVVRQYGEDDFGVRMQDTDHSNDGQGTTSSYVELQPNIDLGDRTLHQAKARFR